MHRRILEGCLACLLCFTGSIPAFAAETATPANADERRENPPGLESEASETRKSGTPETPEAPEEVSLILVTEIQKEDELLSLPDFTLPLRTTPSDDDLEEIYQLALRYQTVCATVTAGEEIRQETFSVAWDFSAIDQTTPGEYTAAGRIELPKGYAFGEAVLQELQISVRVEEMPPAVITSIESNGILIRTHLRFNRAAKPKRWKICLPFPLTIWNAMRKMEPATPLWWNGIFLVLI